MGGRFTRSWSVRYLAGGWQEETRRKRSTIIPHSVERICALAMRRSAARSSFSSLISFRSTTGVDRWPRLEDRTSGGSSPASGAMRPSAER